MWAVVYQFTIHPEKREDFRVAWRALTKLIYQYENSLGSRLHHLDEYNYIAYAQWPDQCTFEDSGKNLPTEAETHRDAMKQCCTEIKTLYKMNITDDLLFEIESP